MVGQYNQIEIFLLRFSVIILSAKKSGFFDKEFWKNYWVFFMLMIY